MKYLIFYPDGTIQQTNVLSNNQIEDCFICDTYVFKYEKGDFYTLVDEGDVNDDKIWEKVGGTKMKKEYEGDFMNFDCIECSHTNRVVIKNGEQVYYYCSYCGEKLVNQEKEPEIIKEFNEFIKNWTDNNYVHLIDSDDNDGERFREKLRKLCGED